MEEAAEKMAALKKVYADIILNTAKESAARVMASDRRALVSQQGLAVAKEEAIATLLRVKSIMDSKIREAETASLGQLRKIQELEAQLGEAEDTISSLRAELKRVNNELTKMKNNIAESLNGQNANGHVTSSIDECQEGEPSSDAVLCSLVGCMSTSETNTNLSQITVEGHHYSIEHLKQSELLKVSSAENECASNPDLASIIMRSKEPELYRNGCTQRIRAFEHNLMTAKVPLGQRDDQFLKLNNEIVCENGKVERSCSLDSAVADKIAYQVKNSIESEEFVNHASSFENGQIIGFSRKAHRKQTGRRSCIKPTNSGIFLGRDMADNEPSDTVGSKNSEDGNGCPGMSFTEGGLGLLPCNETTGIRKNVSRHSHSDSENQILQSSTSSAENIGCGGSIRDSSLTDMRDCLLTGSAQNDDGNTVQEHVSMLMTPDNNTAENSHNSLSKTNPETSDAPTTNSDVKDENICVSSGTAQAGTNRFLKYTFQRKRKRGSSNSKDENILPEKKNASKRTGDNQNALLGPQKSIVVELPRNNRRLMQVARQLISLSERRW